MRKSGAKRKRGDYKRRDWEAQPTKRYKRRGATNFRQPAWTLSEGVNAPVLRGMPEKFKATLIYRNQLTTLNPSLGGLAAQAFFSANGLFDPEVTGVGHQPAGFDQLMAFYDHYTVIGSKIICSFTNGDSSNVQTAGIYLADATTTVTDIAQIIENGGVVYSELANNLADGFMKTLTLNCNPTKFLGRKSALSDDVLRGNASANPSEDVLFCIFAAPQAAVDGGSVFCSVTIEYTAIFTERKRIAIS